MSYILDALKRADAERQRGAVPGLHARHATTPVFQAAAHGAQRRVWLAVAAALALAGISAGLWRWQSSAVRLAVLEPAGAIPPVPAPLAQPVPAPEPAPSSVLPPAVVAPPRRVSSLPPAVMSAAAPPQSPSKRVPAAPAAGMAPPSRPRLDPVATSAQPGVAARATALPLPRASAAAPQAAPAAIPLLSDLSEETRRQIPALVITGSVYSENPGQRLLLINNQVLSQGALVAPDVSLEEIRVKSSVFSFRGTRFRLAH